MTCVRVLCLDQLEHQQQLPNGQAQMQNRQVLQASKQRIESKLRSMAQSLLDQRIVSVATPSVVYMVQSSHSVSNRV